MSRIKDFLDNHLFGLLTFLFFYGAFVCIWGAYRFDRHSPYFLLLFIAGVICLIVGICFCRKFLRQKKGTIHSYLKSFLGKVGMVVSWFRNRAKRNINPSIRLSGNIKITFERPKNKIMKKKKPKRRQKKWKNLQDNRERLGYLYAALVTRKIKHGKDIFASETPSEIEKHVADNDEQHELFVCYVHCRYDERNNPNSEKLFNLKEKLEIK